MPQTITISADTRAATFEPASLNEEQRTIDIVWTTGARVKRSSWWDGDFYEELSVDKKHVRMDRLESGNAPFLKDHDSRTIDSVLGVITSARLEKTRGVATVRFAREDPEADRAWNKIRQGILPNVSVGYRVHRFEKIEGGDETTPVFRATDWEPHEVSIVPIGADAGAIVRSSAPDSLNSCTLITRHAPLENVMPNENTPPAAPPPPPVDLDAVRAQAREQERERVAEITKLAKRSGLEGLDVELIERGTNIADARTIVLEKLFARDQESAPAPNGSHLRIEVGDTQDDKRARNLTAALLQRAGSVVSEAVRTGKLEKTETDPGEFRGLSMLDLARENLEARGFSTRGKGRLEVARMFFERSPGLTATGDLPVVMEDVINKTLLAAYTTAPDTWRSFVATREVPDFKAVNLYRNGSFGTLPVVNEHGEYKNAVIPDGEKLSVTTEKRGAIIGITEEMLINDDFGALADLATRFGRAAGLTIESEVYAFLNANGGLGPTMGDSQPFFHANRANVATGAALSVAGIDADRLVLGRQKDPSNNEFLAIRPSVLLVPDGLESAARVINNSAYDHDGTKLQRPNPVNGLFREVVGTPRLSGTRRYVFGDPALYPVIYAVFLEGYGQGPKISSREGWRVDGIEWKVKQFFKINAGDYRGAVTNAGA